MYTNIFIAAGSYLLGSIPFGYLLVRICRGEDVRRSGSGNIGATNVSRTSPVLGVVTLVLDALKGVAAVMLAIIFYDNTNRSLSVIALMSLAALCAVVGHMFPVWLKFRGGKGVATGLGSFAMIAPVAVLASAVIFLVVILISRYVSLASIVSVALFPSLVWTLHQYGHSLAALVFMTIASLLIIFKHRQNIHRLLTGTENRFGSKRA
ncbi:MAG TPA: glycerol-3-phosphate 1-O-acyltransferase PlsY [Candidatus Solibacter sp.]|nr:glycerol-3-phosphate 1-O-acyltransferase PlsY [Candidatus Solibacter sp.]